jgi:hypothetical protein
LQYSITQNFAGHVDTTALTLQLAAFPLDHIDTIGDALYMYFTSTLTTEQTTAINGVVSAYVWVPPVAQTTSAIYQSVVSADGTGDFLLLSQAVAAGNAVIYIKNGIYYEGGGDIVLPDGVHLIGESQSGVILVMLSGAIKINGPIPVVGGTISYAHASTQVVGVGTTFTGLTAGVTSIMIGMTYYLVKSIESDTALTLSDQYNGSAQTGAEFRYQVPQTGSTMEKLIIVGGGLSVTGLRHGNFTAIALKSCGFTMNNCTDMNIMSLIATFPPGIGMTLTNCTNLSIKVFDVFGSPSHGIDVENCTNIVLDTCLTKNNGGNGFNVSGSTNIIFNSVVSQFNYSCGICVTSSTQVSICGVFSKNASGVDLSNSVT